MDPMIDIVDSHAHLTGDEMYPTLAETLERAKQVGVVKIMNICTDVASLNRGIELSHKQHWIYQAGATTPHDVEKEGESAFEIFARAARDNKLRAIGETGLDYHYMLSAKEIQKEFLRRYLKLAIECKLPVIIHCRDAFDDLFKILDEEYNHKPGVLHCFTGTMDEAMEVIKRGWMLSLSGIVTFKKSTELQEVARHIPLNQILIETDAPYLAPHPLRGKLNEPAFLVHTAQFIADLREMSLEKFAAATKENAAKLFRW